MVGTLDGGAPARVDRAGLVTPWAAAWSLDWWIGADDRWYLPAREPTVRQRRLGMGPVVETTVRIPSGDARHVAYGALLDGREATVIEVHNDSPVPVALAMAVRPYTVAGFDHDEEIRLLQLDESLVRLGGAAMLLPRPPNQSGGSVATDTLDALLTGEELDWDRSGPGLMPNGVLLYPLPHRTSLRFAVLSTVGDDPMARPGDDDRRRPSAVLTAAPDADQVARGWGSVVTSKTRLELPNPGLTDQLQAARARLLLATPELGRQLAAARPGAGRVLGALALAGHEGELAAALSVLVDGFPSRLEHEPRHAIEVVEAVALAVTLSKPGVDRSELLTVAAQLVHLVERASGRTGWGRRGDRRSPLVERGKAALADLARAAGDDEPADHLTTDSSPAGAQEADGADSADDGNGDVEALLAGVSGAGSWGGDELGPAARFIGAVRSLLIDDAGPDLLVLPQYPSAWRGGGAEVHRAPTRFGALSFAIRWHGPRPALLWDLDGGPQPVVVRCPALDAEWSSTDRRGETLLAGSADPLPAAPMPGDSFT